ncbi:hypothetical protein CIC12_32140, partial [Burkholderia sp. SG-MS1]
MEPGSSEADRRPPIAPRAAADRDQQDRNGAESGHRQSRATIDVQPDNPEDQGNEQIYTWDSQHENLYLFHSRKDADQFVWQDYRKQHPDAPEQSHIDNEWDVFRRGFSDTAQNPVGQIISQIARFAGSSPETQKRLYEAGNNIPGFLGAELSAAAGASPETQDFFRKLGEVVEHLIPVWGEARTLSGMLGKAANGEELSLDDHQNVQGLFKELLS